MTKAILVLNAGSSSLKFSVYELASGDHLYLLAKGQIEGIPGAPHFKVTDHDGHILVEERWDADVRMDHAYSLKQLSVFLRHRYQTLDLLGVGHRVVHGGARYAAPIKVDAAIMKELESFIPMAPLHQPHNLAAIRAVSEINPQVPQVACFDTAFHSTQEPLAQLFGLPYAYFERGVRRYGFHGLSYEYVAAAMRQQQPEIAAGKVVIAHLGNGASMCAVCNGKSVASSMGFTALDGLLMGTRSGDLDPGVVLYLLQHEGLDAQQIEDLLYKRSGLLGLSGISGDMRVLLDNAAPRARLAVDYFVRRISLELGALAASMQGIDALVFTAGIGENSAEIRRRVCLEAAWLGIQVDDAANDAGKACISRADSSCSAWLIATNEELMIARHTLAELTR
jgi:acetate kinase